MLRGGRYTHLAVMKDIDIAGLTRRIPIEWCATADVTFRIAVHRQEPEDVGLYLDSGTASLLDLLRQPPGVEVSFDVQRAGNHQRVVATGLIEQALVPLCAAHKLSAVSFVGVRLCGSAGSRAESSRRAKILRSSNTEPACRIPGTPCGRGPRNPAVMNPAVLNPALLRSVGSSSGNSAPGFDDITSS